MPPMRTLQADVTPVITAQPEEAGSDEKQQNDAAEKQRLNPRAASHDSCRADSWQHDDGKRYECDKLDCD